MVMKFPEHLVWSTRMVTSLEITVQTMDMIIIMDTIDQLIRHYDSEKRWGADGEMQLLDRFLAEYSASKDFPKKARKLMDLMLLIHKFPPLKPLQVLRVLTRNKELLQLLPLSLLQLLNEHLPETVEIPLFMIEALAIHIRYIELDHKMVTDEMLTRVLEVLASSKHPEVLKMVIQITKEMVHRKRTKVLEEIWYIAKILFVLDKQDDSIKVRIISLITALLDCSTFNENFRMTHGVSALISELKKSQNNVILKISILNAIQKLLEQNQAIYDFKTHGIIPLLQGYLQLSSYFAEVCLIINIFNKLIFDDELNLKFIERGLSYIINLLVKTHPSNHHLLKFQDIEEANEKDAIQELTLLLFRLLRFLFSIEKNRKIFKMIFPPQLLGPFIDVGNFIRSISKYRHIGEIYASLSPDDVENILEKYEMNEKDIVEDKQTHKMGSYVLVESVGKGAFGTVYLAKKGENKYALKKILLNNTDESESDRMKEVKINEQLKHPNIVSYYQSFVEEGYLCIVMEFIQGFSLSELLKIQNEKSTPFEEKQIWKIVIGLLSVLKYLHVDKRILHLDINPSNIMIDNNFNIKLADFGLARAITQPHQAASFFQGTLIYSSPEILYRKPYCHKADIWSFGCVLYELMMLRPPYHGSNSLMVANIIVSEPFDAIPDTLYTEELRNIVMMALEKDQQSRPDALKLMTLIVDKIVTYADTLRSKEIVLNNEITHITKKLNKKQPLSISSVQEAMRQTQLVKIDTHNLNKIGEDPLVKFLDAVRKLSLINGSHTSFKNNFKKFIIDLFYNKVIVNHDIDPSKMKTELSKLINLSKEEVELLKVKYDKKDHKNNITYEMLYFYIEELYELLRKG